MASVAANLMGGKRGGGSFEPADFFASLSDRPAAPVKPKRASDEEIAAGWELWAAMCGAKPA